jgi:hypothetical protein
MGGEESYIQMFHGGNVKVRDHLEDIGICGRVLLK